MCQLIQAAPTPESAPKARSDTNALVDKLAEVIASGATSNPAPSEGEPKQKEKVEENDFESTATKKYKLCPEAYQNLLIMCGLTNEHEEQIPPFWRKIAQQNTSSSDKLGMARTHLAENVIWRECKAPPLHPLLTMIVNRKFEEETTLNILKSACMGLTPFAVPHLSDSEVKSINKQSTTLQQTTSMTIQDVLQHKVKATVPKTFKKLVMRIKMFGNVLFAFFGHCCPLLVEIHDILDNLNKYSEYACSNASKKTLAIILWILHLQSRHFAAGRMDGSQSLIAHYRHMITCVQTTVPVFNANVPEELYVVKEKKEKKQQHIQDYFGRQQQTHRDDYWNARQDRGAPYLDHRGYRGIPRFDCGPSPYEPDRYMNNNRHFRGDQNPFKRQKVDIVELKTYHPKIKEAVKVLRGQGRLPRVQDMCKICNISPDSLFERNEIYIKGTLFSTCFASCPRQHVEISDQEA